MEAGKKHIHHQKDVVSNVVHYFEIMSPDLGRRVGYREGCDKTKNEKYAEARY